MSGTRSIGFEGAAPHGGMHVAENGRQIFIGNIAAIEAFALTRAQWWLLFLFATIGLPTAIIVFVYPTALKDPFILLGTLLMLTLGATALLAVRSVIRLTASAGHRDLVVFDLDRGTVEVLFQGTIGLTQDLVAFSEIQRMKLGRGNWDGEAVKSVLVLELDYGRAISIDADLSNKDLTMLRVITGVRSC